MGSKMILITLGILYTMSFTSYSKGYAEAAPSGLESGLSHFQPMVSLLCGHGKVHNQYLDEGRRWTTDLDPKATCTKDKLEILEYCRNVYPKRDIRNIVESGRYYKIDGWCKVGQKKCKGSHWVKPYRCLEGPFQSDALLVPEHCLFDHIHNQSVCQSFDEWNSTATHSCNERSMQLRSFAMLLPCGVDIFSGVEFVCCPAESKAKNEIPMPSSKEETSNTIDGSSDSDSLEQEGEDDDDEEDDIERNDDNDYENNDDYYDDDDVQSSSTTTTTTTTTTTAVPTTTTEKPIDHYFSHFDSKHEHENFKEAQKYLEETHRDKVTKVMKEWSELEERYQDMKVKDPKAAEDFRKKMSAHFQKTVEALEDEGAAEKRHLSSMHQQRVMTIINIRKKSSMDCYTAALDKVPYSTKKIEKCLEKLLRALEKDRTHTLHHYRHLINSNPKQATNEKESLLEHLDNLNHIANQSIAMLERVPSIADKIKERMVSIWFRLNAETSGNKLVEDNQLEPVNSDTTKIEVPKEVEPTVQSSNEVKTSPEDQRLVVTYAVGSTETPTTIEVDDLLIPKAAHIQSQTVHHNEIVSKTFSVHKDSLEKFRWNGSIYITLAFAGIALLTAMIVGIVLLRRHTHRSPHGQGFVEVEQASTPEERHVANMQVNGYENPTYKYFEAQNN